MVSTRRYLGDGTSTGLAGERWWDVVGRVVGAVPGVFDATGTSTDTGFAGAISRGSAGRVQLAEDIRGRLGGGGSEEESRGRFLHDL